MIRFCTYILLVVLTLQSFYRSIMVVDYQIHLPEYLAKCINRDKPELNCDGQCLLMKKIEEKEKEETKKNLVVYEYSSVYVHTEQPLFITYQAIEDSERQVLPPYQDGYVFNYSAPILRPPVSYL